MAGDSDQQVFDYLVARYGDFVLLRPPMKPETYILWFGPAVVFLLGAIAVGFYFMRLRQRVASEVPTPLTAQEEQRLAQLMTDPQQREEDAAPSQTANRAVPGGPDHDALDCRSRPDRNLRCRSTACAAQIPHGRGHARRIRPDGL